MEKCAADHLVWPNYAQMGRIKSRFQDLYDLQNCCGVIVSTRIKMKALSPITEKNHSMILQAIIDPFLRFRDVYISSPGDLNEAQVLEGSDLFTLCENGSRLGGEKEKISGEAEAALKEYIVGDEAYPLRPWLLTPHEGKNLADNESNFNNRWGPAITMAKEALSSLKERFQFLKGDLKPDSGGNLQRIIFMCFLIHNIIADLEDDSVLDRPAASEGAPKGRRDAQR